MKIRLAKTSDVLRIAKLDSEVFPKTAFSQGLKVFRAAFKNRIQGTCFVAESEGKLIGAIVAEKRLSFTDSSTSYIASFFVAEKWRKKGVGTALFEKCLAALRSKGIGSVSLTVHPANKTALKMYKKRGFKLYRLSLLKEL